MPRYKFTLSDDSSSEILAVEPQGWENMTFEMTRDNFYHGVFNDFTLDLTFLCVSGGGYDFIKSRYDQNGSNTQIFLQVAYQCDKKDAFSVLFNGLLDINTIEITNDQFLGVTVGNLDIRRVVTGRDEVPINMSQTTSLDGTTLNNYTYGGYDLNLHSRTIQLNSELSLPTGTVVDHTASITGGGPIYGAWFQNGEDLINDELRETLPNAETIDIRTGGGYGVNNANIFEIHEAKDRIISYPGTYVCTYDFSGDYFDIISSAASRTLAGNLVLNIYWGPTLFAAGLSGQVETAVVISGYTDPTVSYTVPFSGSGTVNMTLNYGDKIWLAWGFVSGAGYSILPSATYDVTFRWDYDTCDIDFTLDSTSPSTTCDAWAIHEAYSRVCESITNNVNLSFYSEFFGRKNSQPQAYDANGCGSFITITNGLKIRAKDVPLFIKLKDLFEATNAMFNIGLGFETIDNNLVVRVEDKAYFYDASTVIFTASNVDNISMTIAQDRYYNTVEIGYDKWEPEEINGLDETNTKHEYVLSDVSLKNDYNVVSPYLTGGYAIETTRRIKQLTEDTKYDNDNFVIAVKRGVDGSGNPNQLNTPETNTNLSASTGVPFPTTVYNIEHTPKRCLLRHMNVLAGSIFWQLAQRVDFQSGEGNYTADLTIDSIGCPGDFTGANLAENASVAWNAASLRLNEPLWIPEVYEFTYPVSIEDYLAIKANPYGVIEFSRDSVNYKKGFILGMDYTPETQLAEFRLLRAYEN